MSLTRRSLLTAPLVAGAAAAFGTAFAQGEGQPVTVVELFTSQGCSSCPPSDAYLGELSKRSDIIALSFHVDYWDYIGWKDPYASPQFTERQRGYARSLKQRYVYTPEMVVQGRGHDSGINRVTVRDLIAEAQKPEVPRIVLKIVDRGAAGVTAIMPRFEAAQPCDVWLITYDPEHKTKVLRGENRGRDLTNHNVVRSLTLLTRWDGQPAELAIGPDNLTAARGIVVLVQHPDLGPILGAAALMRDV